MTEEQQRRYEHAVYDHFLELQGRIVEQLLTIASGMPNVMNNIDRHHIFIVYKNDPLAVTRKLLTDHVVGRALYLEFRTALYKNKLGHVWEGSFPAL